VVEVLGRPELKSRPMLLRESGTQIIGTAATSMVSFAIPPF
jgi:hypothetical protein